MREGTSPESEPDRVGEPVGDEDGDEVESRAVVRGFGILEGVVSEFDATVGIEVDPLVSCAFELEFKSGRLGAG